MSVCRMAGGSQGSRACLLTASALRKKWRFQRQRGSTSEILSPAAHFPSNVFSIYYCSRKAKGWCVLCSTAMLLHAHPYILPGSARAAVCDALCVRSRSLAVAGTLLCFLLEISSACCSLIFAHLCLLSSWRCFYRWSRILGSSEENSWHCSDRYSKIRESNSSLH
jgi:hypothetical protein